MTYKWTFLEKFKLQFEHPTNAGLNVDKNYVWYSDTAFSHEN